MADFDVYPFSIPAVRKLDRIVVGENGLGKSTLLEAIAVMSGFNTEGGRKNFHFATRESHLELSRYLRAESFYNVATEIERLDENSKEFLKYCGGKSLYEQSHGESFLALLMHRFYGNALYILDEPEAALSPMRQLAMLRRIHDLVADSSQFIIATHSPILMAYPGAKIIKLDDAGPREVAYEETEHYQVTKQFFDRRERMLAQLLED